MVGRISSDLVFAEEMISGVAADIAGRNLTENEIAGRIADLFAESGGFIVDVFDRARVFSYSDLIAATDPQCTTDFSRSFHHIDWIDGESVVQAEQTTFEDGFNTRFHRIENDLDNLGSDLAKAFACVAELRASLHTSLTEIQAEINRINEDVHECCKSDSGSGGFTIPSDEVFVPGIAGTWVGNTIVDDKEFLVYENLGRYELVPKVELDVGTIVGGAGGGTVINPGNMIDRERLNRPAELAKWFESDPEVQDFIRSRGGDTFTARDLTENFGDRVINSESGLTLSEAVSGLPVGTTFKNTTEMVDMMIELESSAVRGSRSAGTVVSSFGVNDRTEIGGANVSTLDMVTDEMSEALTRSGINTVDELSNMNSTRLTRALRRSGVNISNSDVVAVLTNARTVSRLGQ